ncbi:MAG: HEAT repeat domain-containing protein [Planctomycetota bacterium]|jgi:hypothetical protein
MMIKRQFLFGNLLIIIPPILVLIAWFIARYLGWIPKRRDLANSAPAGNRITRMSEATVLLCAATAIFVFIATNTSTGGRMLILDELHPVFASVNRTVAICAGVCLLLSVLVCLFRRTFVATILAAFVLIVYATLLNGPGELLEKMAGKEATERQVTWTINIGGCDVKGAELWVNGNRLGTLPYTTTPEEFKSKVPYWAEAPAEMQNREDFWKVPEYSPWSSRGYDFNGRRWATIVMPGENAKRWGSHRHDTEGDKKARTYYAQVKFGNEWGYSRGRSGGGGGGRYIYHANTTIGRVRFPEREKRMETLLDKARLADYQPVDDWFDAIETFGEDAVIAIRQLIATEPQMDDVLIRWARRKYKLDQVNNEMSAWRAFKAICGEADSERAYSTTSIAGKAVELLVPMLDSEILANKAIKIVRSTNRYGWYHWQLAGQKHFGYAERPKGLRTGSRRTMGEWRGGGRNKLPIHAYAVAHAVWKMDEWLGKQDPLHENIIEQKVVPEYVAQNYNDINRLKLANHIGSKQLDRYLLRQDWRADAKSLPWDQELRIMGTQINGWLYLLSTIDSPAGRTFRRDQYHRVVELADSILKQSHETDWDTQLDFLFLELELGEKSLAWRYWPRYRRKVKGVFDPQDKLQLQYEYLSRMEPYSTVQMYVECWRDFKGEFSDFQQGLSEFKGTIPEEKRRFICQALLAEIDKTISNVEMRDNDNRKEIKRYLTGAINSFEWNYSKSAAYAEKVLYELNSEKSNVKPERVKDWLANVEPGHPLMPMLADDENPAFRMLVLDAIKAHPTPANRAILQNLLQDGDEEVRKAAEEVAAALKSLKEAPVEQLAAKLDEIVKISVEEPASQLSGR